MALENVGTETYRHFLFLSIHPFFKILFQYFVKQTAPKSVL